ncbi:MAG: tetratricopeptide repeat protein [Kofleriaceae bacterium]
MTDNFEEVTRQFLASVNSPAELDIAAFLAATSSVSISASERIRRLAIVVEEDHLSGDVETDWRLLSDLYDAAGALAPDDPRVLHSRGIAAFELALTVEDEPIGQALFALAESTFRELVRVEPESADGMYGLGRVAYDRDKDPSAALDWFAEAIKRPNHDCMAVLYTGHCLQDLKDWPRALAAYERVDRKELAENWPAWRSTKLREQTALCRLRVGDRARALAELTELVTELEAKDDAALLEASPNCDELLEAATIELREELFDRATALANRFGTTGPELA